MTNEIKDNPKGNSRSSAWFEPVTPAPPLPDLPPDEPTPVFAEALQAVRGIRPDSEAEFDDARGDDPAFAEAEMSGGER